MISSLDLKVAQDLGTVTIKDVNVDRPKYHHFRFVHIDVHIYDHFFCFAFHLEALKVVRKTNVFWKTKVFKDVFGDQNVLLNSRPVLSNRIS